MTSIVHSCTMDSPVRPRSSTPSSFPSVLAAVEADCDAAGVKLPRALRHQLAPLSCHVERIVLRRSFVSPKVLEAVAKQLPCLVNLESIDFAGSEVCFVGLQFLIDALVAMPLEEFNLTMPGGLIGPRAQHAIGRLLTRHPHAVVRGVGEAGMVTAADVSPSPMRIRYSEEPAPVVRQSSSFVQKRGQSESVMSPPTRTHTDLPSASSGFEALRMGSQCCSSAGDDDAALEEQLELEMAERLARLQAPLDELHRNRLLAAVGRLDADEAEVRDALRSEFYDGIDRLTAAWKFALPFKAPVFDPEGPLCSALPTRPAEDDDDLEELREKLFVALDSLQRQAQATLGDPVRGVDGRMIRKARLLPGESVEEAATRFGLTAKELHDANSSAMIPSTGDASVVWVPQSLESTLLEELQAERAAGARCRHAQSAVQIAGSLGDEESGAESRAVLLKWQGELKTRKQAREHTQRELRDQAIRMYEKRRDLWLRFLKRQQMIVDDFVRVASRELLHREETLSALHRHMVAEGDAVVRAAAAKQVPESEHELRALRLKAKQIETRCSHRLSSSPASSAAVAV